MAFIRPAPTKSKIDRSTIAEGDVQDLVESGVKLVPCGNQLLIDMVQNGYRGRHVPLDSLPRTPSMCKWCGVNATPTNRHHYCGQECALSADIFCYPQGFASKTFHLVKQGWKCLSCERELFSPQDDGSELRAELDHIVPIFKGGASLGWDNHQILCVDCHAWKTKEEKVGYGH